MSEIVFCSVFRGRNPEVVKNIRTHSPFVDRTFIVLHGSEEDNKENIEFFESEECKKLNVSWELADIPYSPTLLRNTYLHKLPPGTWCLQLDCDEFLEQPGVYQLRKLVEQSEPLGVTHIGFNAHDIRVGLDGAVGDNKTNYWNPLFIKLFPGTSWVGETHGGISSPGIQPKLIEAPYRYFHIKTTASEWLRSARNYWTSGVSAANDTSAPEWQEFKQLCKHYDLLQFDDLYKKMVDGDMPEELQAWFVLQRNNENPEARSLFVVYFGLMHPEQNTYLSGNRDIAYDKNRKPYLGEMTY